MPHGVLPRGMVFGLAAAVLLSSAVLTACSAEDAEPVAVTSPTPSASPTPTPEPPTTLLSGRPGKDDQVLAVKIDNTVNSHPQSGLMAADVIYVEEVEWGLTRFMAVFSSRYPKQVGPIRSARETDIELLAQYGKVAFSASGGQPAVLNAVNAAPLYPVTNIGGTPGYTRTERPAPWDLFAQPKQLLKSAPKAAKAKDIGFRFDEEVPKGGKRSKGFTVTWPYSEARFAWSPKEDRWLLWSDGSAAMSTEGPQLGGTTVIVQSVDAYPSDLGDRYGGVTPFSETVGKGKAWLFRDGRKWPITWSRPKAESGTIWRFRGERIPFDPGQVWVLLLDNDRKPAIR